MLRGSALVTEYVEKWKRLDDYTPLAQLHSRFWGTSMQEEEAAWRAKEGLTPAPSNNNLRPNEEPGNGTDESEGGDNDNDDDDDDTIPGCYVLNINLQNIESIWVRAEFIRIYDGLVKYYNEKTIYKGVPAPSAVVTGQPGIGKSVWLYYALRRCLAERRPVIFRYCLEPYLFCDEGVIQMGAGFQSARYKSILWALVDSDESQTGVPCEFVVRNTRFFTIYTTSPASEHWSRLEKTTFPTVIIMNPWSRSEIHRAVKLHPYTLDSKFIDDIYDRFGPTPRLCIQKASDSGALEAYEDNVSTALGNLTLQSLQDLIYRLQDLKMDGVSHKLYLIKRQNIGHIRSLPYVTYITNHIRSRIAIQMRNLNSLQQVKLYCTFACTPSRGMAEHLFESFCQQNFQIRILIDYIPMIQLTGHDGQHKHQWHTSHYPVRNQILEKSHQNALHHMATLDVYPLNTCEYNDQDVSGLTLTPNVYYIPSMQNAVAINSFIYHDRYLYLLHFSDSQEHKIDLKFMSHFTQYANFPPWSRWRLIFIVPDDVKDLEVLTCLHSQSPELQTLKLFLSKVKMKDYLKMVHVKGQEEKEKEPPHKKQKCTEAPLAA